MKCTYKENGNCQNCNAHTWQECGKRRGFFNDLAVENPQDIIKRLVQQLIKERARNSRVISRVNQRDREDYESVDFSDDRR